MSQNNNKTVILATGSRQRTVWLTLTNALNDPAGDDDVRCGAQLSPERLQSPAFLRLRTCLHLLGLSATRANAILLSLSNHAPVAS